MYSELVAVDRSGSLRQWRWDSVEPAEHPKVASLGLKPTKVGLDVWNVIVLCYSAFLVTPPRPKMGARCIAPWNPSNMPENPGRMATTIDGFPLLASCYSLGRRLHYSLPVKLG